MDAAAVVHAFFDHLADGSIDDWMALQSPDICAETPFAPVGQTRRYEGAGEVRRRFGGGREQMQALEFYDRQIHASTDGPVVATCRSRGTTGDGSHYENTYCWLFTIGDDGITRWVQYYDPQQIGRATPTPSATPTLEFIAHADIDLAAPMEVGTVPTGVRRIIPIIGGNIEGPRISAEILNGGADWQVVAEDGSAAIDTRYSARTTDGHFLYLQTQGFRHAPRSVLARLGAGEDVDPSEYYFRLTVRLECGAPTHAWVNNTVFVASAQRRPAGVTYDLFAVC